LSFIFNKIKKKSQLNSAGSYLASIIYSFWFLFGEEPNQGLRHIYIEDIITVVWISMYLRFVNTGFLFLGKVTDGPLKSSLHTT